MSLAAEVGGVASEGETLNCSFRHADTGSGIAKGKTAEWCQPRTELPRKSEGDLITLIVDGAPTIDVSDVYDSGIIKFRARERTVLVSTACNEHLAIGQQRRRVCPRAVLRLPVTVQVPVAGS